MKWFPSSLLLALAVVTMILSPSAQAATRVYVGSAGYDKGVSTAGHSFAIVQPEGVADLQAAVYEYTVRNRDDSKVSASDSLLHPGKSQLVSTKTDLYDFYLTYSGIGDRVLTFHELNLTDRETNELVKQLEADASNPNFSSEFAYSVYTRNCVTRLIDLINQVVPSSKKIELIEHFETVRSSQGGFRAAISNGLLNRIPFNLSRVLEKHPISKGRAAIFERLSDTHLRFQIAIGRRIKNVSKVCSWQSTIADAFRTFLALAERDPNKYDAGTVILRSASVCPQARADFSVIALILSRAIYSDDFVERRARLSEIGTTLAGPP